MNHMAILVVAFSREKGFWLEINCSQMKLPNKKNKVIQKLMLSKNVNNKKCAPKIVFFNEKIERFGCSLL